MMKNYGLLSFVMTGMLLLFFSCQQQSSTNQDNQSGERVQDSLQKISSMIRQDSSNALLYYQRAGIYIHERKINDAFRDIKHAILLQPEDARFYIALSDIYLMQGKIASSKESLEKAVKLDPGSKDAFLKLAELNLILKDYDNTFEHLKRAIDIEPLNPTAYFISGYAFLELEDTSRAIENFSIAVDQNQNYYDAYMSLGNIYAARKHKLAIDYYNNALNINPQSAEAYYNLALFYQNTEQIQEAIDTYDKLLKIEPSNQYAIYNLGFINLVYLKEFEKAVHYFTQAINIDQEYFDAYFNRGYAQELLGNYNEARWDYQKALELKTNYPKAIDGLNRLDEIQFQLSE